VHCESEGGFAPIMDLLHILYRLVVNFAKDMPVTPGKLRAMIKTRRRATASRQEEIERVDRIRNPRKYRPV
jgi:hypothetical protein